MNTLELLRGTVQEIAPELTVSDAVLQRAEEMLAEQIRKLAPDAIRKAVIDSMEIRRPTRRYTRRKIAAAEESAEPDRGVASESQEHFFPKEAS